VALVLKSPVTFFVRTATRLRIKLLQSCPIEDSSDSHLFEIRYYGSNRADWLAQPCCRGTFHRRKDDHDHKGKELRSPRADRTSDHCALWRVGAHLRQNDPSRSARRIPAQLSRRDEVNLRSDVRVDNYSALETGRSKPSGYAQSPT